MVDIRSQTPEPTGPDDTLMWLFKGWAYLRIVMLVIGLFLIIVPFFSSAAIVSIWAVGLGLFIGLSVLVYSSPSVFAPCATSNAFGCLSWF